MTPLAQPTPLATGSLSMLVVWAIVIFGMFFLMRRPMKRQQEQQRQMQSTMQPGTRVMLSSGLFGTITHIGDKQAIVELAPGLEVTVLRQVLSKVVQPDEEEFEFADQVDDDHGLEADTDGVGVDAATAAGRDPWGAQGSGASAATSSGPVVPAGAQPLPEQPYDAGAVDVRAESTSTRGIQQPDDLTHGSEALRGADVAHDPEPSVVDPGTETRTDQQPR